MFFDKLLVRIRGELLTLREDLAAEEDLRGRAELLLRRLEERLGGSEVNPAGQASDRLSNGPEHETNPVRTGVPADLKKEWEDLMKRKAEKKVHPGDDAPPPNPRELG